MKVGLQINRFNFRGGTKKIGENVKKISIAAEKADFDSIWVMDHFFQIGGLGQPEEPMLEAYTTLGYIAGVTSKVKLGMMVTGVIYREPAVLINAVTALDVLSGGRAYFGIGAGWNDQEANALGLPDPLHSKRFDRLEDTLKLSIQMWAGDTSPFEGKIYNLPYPMLEPNSISRPHPPILIGGGGEEKTLRYVAKYGDACNLFAKDPEEMTRKLGVLKNHCKEIGRSYDEIEKTVLAGVDVASAASNPNRFLEICQNLRKVGIDHAILAVSASADPKDYDKLSDVIKQIHKI